MSPSAHQLPATVKTPISAITPTTATNARKSLTTAAVLQSNVPALTLTPTHSNHVNSIPERTDHEYSSRKRAPSPPAERLYQSQIMMKRTRKIQAEQNSEYLTHGLQFRTHAARLVLENRYKCSMCSDKFGHKNALALHEKFYCKSRPEPEPVVPLILTPHKKREQRLDVSVPTEIRAISYPACPSPAPSSSSSFDLVSDCTNKSDLSAFITTVRELDVIIPETMRQDEIVLMTKTPRFLQILDYHRRK